MKRKLVLTHFDTELSRTQKDRKQDGEQARKPFTRVASATNNTIITYKVMATKLSI